jgi:Zn-dependent protease
MQSGWQVGSVLGIPLIIDKSWLFILAMATFIYGSSWQVLGWGSPLTWLSGFIMALLLFISVLLHELGHSLVARQQGITVSSITLFLFGGIAAIDEESKTPSEAFQVAIAGPTVSFCLFLLLTGAAQLLPRSAPIHAIAGTLAGINLVLALFNMIPGLPLDGGQVLKAAVWKVTGSRLKGIRYAARAGQTLGWLAIALSVFLYVASGLERLDLLWLGLIGWFVARSATAYYRLSEVQEALLSLKAADAINHNFRLVDANLTVAQFADKYLASETAHPVFYARANDQPYGQISLEAMQVLERSQWEITPVKALAEPLDTLPTLTEQTTLPDVVQQLDLYQLRSIPVLSDTGTVVGVVDRSDIVRALADKLKLQISTAAIQQIKETAAYPQGLPLAAIAKTAKS